MLEQTMVSSAGMKDLALLKELDFLSLEGTQVTDAGLKAGWRSQGRPFPNIRSLSLPHHSRLTTRRIGGAADTQHKGNRGPEVPHFGELRDEDRD
jgi:hypothetical protein